MSFPDDALNVRVQIFVNDDWLDMGPVVSSADDFITDYVLDYVLGRPVWDLRRLPDQEISITHGRSDENSSASASSVSLFLWNDDGYLTPGDRRSPWFPDWDLNCPLRILVDGDVLFWGEVSEISPEWPLGDLSRELDDDELLDLGSVPLDRLGYAVVNITASGILRRLGQRSKPLRSSLYRSITSDNSYQSYLPHLHDYFPLEDGSDATVFASGIPNEQRAPMTFDGDITLSSDSTLDGSEALPSVGAGNTAHWYAEVNGFTGSGVIEMFCRHPERPDKPETVFRPLDVFATGSLARWRIEIKQYIHGPRLVIVAHGADGEELDGDSFDLTSSSVFFTDAPIQMRLDLTESGGSVAYSLSWYRVTRGADVGEQLAGSFSGDLGRVHGIGGGVGVAPPSGVMIGHYVTHDGLPGGWLNHGDDGWWLEPARTRFARLTLEEKVPRVIPSGIDNRSHAMGVQRPSSLMELLGECQDAEVGGILCEDRHTFALKFVHRRFRYNRAPVITLDAALSEIANPFQPVQDDQQRRNDFTATRVDGTSARRIDEASVERYGVYDEGQTYNIASDLIVGPIASWMLWMGNPESLRYPQLTIDLGIAPELIPAWVGVSVGDVIRVTNLPPQHPLGSVDLVVEGWTETLSPFGWVVTINCSPADRWQVAKWGIDRGDARGSVLSSSVDADDTSLSVHVPGLSWTTDDDHFPFGAVIGTYPDDEQVVVTDITGSAPTQTFTVTRDPMFPLAHPAGAEVHTSPAIEGL